MSFFICNKIICYITSIKYITHKLGSDWFGRERTGATTQQLFSHFILQLIDNDCCIGNSLNSTLILQSTSHTTLTIWRNTIMGGGLTFEFFSLATQH